MTRRKLGRCVLILACSMAIISFWYMFGLIYNVSYISYLSNSSYLPNLSELSNLSNLSLSQICNNNIIRRASMNNTAFVTGGIGRYGHEPEIFKCLAFAETLIRIGGWGGNVYIFTDGEITNDIKSSIYNPEMVKLIPISNTRNGVDFRKHWAGGGGGYLKTMIFDIPQITEDILIWNDCDKLIAHTDCIKNMFNHQHNPDPINFGCKSNIFVQFNYNYNEEKLISDPMTCYNDNKWHHCGDHIHVGIFIADRLYSSDIVTSWKKRQEKQPDLWDRYTFYDAWAIDNPLNRVKQIPKSFHDHFWNAGDSYCINHLSNGRLSHKENRMALPSFIEALRLQKVNQTILYNAYSNDGDNASKLVGFLFFQFLIILL